MAAHLRGWINTYFGKIKLRYLRPVLQYLNDRLVAWARSRYKRLNRSWWQARLWLRTIYHDYPSMFVHWQYGFKPYLFDLSYKSRMTGDCQVRFRESLGVRFPLRYSTMIIFLASLCMPASVMLFSSPVHAYLLPPVKIKPSSRLNEGDSEVITL
jgi:hypothetical protein